MEEFIFAVLDTLFREIFGGRAANRELWTRHMLAGFLSTHDPLDIAMDWDGEEAYSTIASRVLSEFPAAGRIDEARLRQVVVAAIEHAGLPRQTESDYRRTTRLLLRQSRRAGATG